MDPQVLNRNLLNSYTLKPTKKDHLFPYFQKLAHHHEKKESNPPKPQPKMPVSKAVSRVNSPKTQKNTPQSKLRQREKSISKAVNAYIRDIKDDHHGGLGPRARSLIKNSARSCLPSPTMKRDDVTMFHASRPVKKEVEEKKKSFFIPHVEPKPETRPPSKEPAKKRVRVIRVEGNQRPSVMPNESNLDYQMYIANPAIEQELFKEYLGTDRQTFGFEKLVISGSYEQCSTNLEATVINSKSTVDTNTSTKPSKMESKLQVLTRDSSNTIGGLTTNTTSRSKGVVGLLNGLNDSKENMDLVELIDWSLEIPSEDNNNPKEKAKLPLQKQIKHAGGHRRNASSILTIGQPQPQQQVKKLVKPASASILKMSSSRVNKGGLKLYKESNKRDVSL